MSVFWVYSVERDGVGRSDRSEVRNYNKCAGYRYVRKERRHRCDS